MDDYDGVISAVRQAIAASLPHGNPAIHRVAHAVGVNPRTLQRRLKAERTSFQKVLTEVRRDLAVRYLSDKRLKSLEVAMLLGYSSISAFTTAFKSWYDMPPAEYRQKFLAA